MCKHAHVYAHVCHTRYICGYTYAWKNVFYTGRAPALCTVSVLHSSNNLFGIIDIGAHKPLWLQAPFIYFMYIIPATSVLYSSPLYMICMSLGNKDHFIVIVIAIVINGFSSTSVVKSCINKMWCFAMWIRHDMCLISQSHTVNGINYIKLYFTLTITCI